MKMNVKFQSIVTQMAKRIFAVSLMLLFYFQMWSTNHPQFTEGTQLYVMANSGLTLRIEPNKNSESLGVVEFGSSVIVLNQPETNMNIEKVNWVQGRWIYVDVEGVTGYMFDGYLSDLPLPIYGFEMCQMDMDLIYPLESWAEVNLGAPTSDTIEAGTLRKVKIDFEGGDKMIKTSRNDEYKIELFLSEVRVMDVYHLLQSMLDSKSSIEAFKEESTFIENREGELYKVNIELDNPVSIVKLKSGKIKVAIKTIDYMCS